MAQSSLRTFNKPSVRTIALMDLNGLNVPFDQRALNSRIEVTIGHSKKGMYFLSCTFDDDETTVTRIVVD